jgi:hypothetical protein
MPIFKIYARASFEGPQPHIVRAGTANESHCWMYPETFKLVGGLEQLSHPTTNDIKEMWDAFLESQNPVTYAVVFITPTNTLPVEGLTFDQAIALLRGAILTAPTYEPDTFLMELTPELVQGHAALHPWIGLRVGTIDTGEWKVKLYIEVEQ